VRRFAREVGVDLSRVTGSGPGGRITRDDVLAVVRHASQTAASAVKQSTATARDAWGPIRPEKMPKIRRTIAAKMHESWTTCPRVTNFDDADVTELERLRLSSKEDYAKKGIKLTSLPFVIKAVASALKHHPTINASLDLEHEQIIYKEYVNIGIAVDTERGLVVPSLRGADELSIPDVARALSQLSDNVRDGSFTTADLQGSTFTISNLGAIGGTYSTPIINTPEVAILLVGRSRKMPVVIDDEVAVRLMMPLSLAYDHRLVDGATAARFLNDVIDYLEAPSRLLLAP
jgi:pyruvate/2-oxoglutarate dehydrogenase complex dihydrolipoamide acyltransferase (E2) component